MQDKPDYMQKARKQLEADATAQPLSIGAVIHLRNALKAIDTERAAHEATKVDAAHWSKMRDIEQARAEKAEAELQALREGVADVVQSAATLKHQGNCTSSSAHPDTCGCGLTQHRRAIRSLLPAPEPDPLVMYVARAISIRATELDAEAPDTCGRLQFIVNRDYLLAEAVIKELTRHGLTIAAIGGKHD